MRAGVNTPSRYGVGRDGVHTRGMECLGVKALRNAVVVPDIAAVIVDATGKPKFLSAAFRGAVGLALVSPQ